MNNQKGLALIIIILIIIVGAATIGGITGGILYLAKQAKPRTIQSSPAPEGVATFAPSPPPPFDLSSVSEINFHQLATGKNFGDILKLFNPVIDGKNKRLYVVGSKTTYVGVVDTGKDELIDVFDIGVPGGFLMFNNNNLYSYDFGIGKCYQIDTNQKKATEISLSDCTAIIPDPGKIAKNWKNYSFKNTGYQNRQGSNPGFPVGWRQDLNGTYGVIEIYNSSNKKVGEIIYGPDALYFDIDSITGRLYTTNTGDGSISIFDLNKLESTNYCEKNSCWIKDIDVGNSVEEIIVDSSGNMYARNRLGGSVIYKYNLSSKSFAVINNEKVSSNNAAIWNNNWSGLALAMWPSGMSLNKDETRLYVLSHQGALFDIINTQTNQVINKIKFDTALKPRTDGISIMAMDKVREKLFAIWPELGLMGVADGKNAKVLGTIDLTQYGFDKDAAANGGPGLAQIAVDEKFGKIYVYFTGKLLVFNSDTLKKETEVSASITSKSEKLLVINPDKKELYLGNKIFNLDTLKESGSFSKGQRVVAFNNDKNAVYLDDKIPVKFKLDLKVYEFINGSETKEWFVSDLGGIVNNFFDFKNNIFYVGDFLSGRVLKQDLTKGSKPNGSSQPSSDNSLPQGSGPAAGKCGDGICGPVEKQKNACPVDCGNQ